MAALADTNVIARWALPHDPLYPICREAVFRLRRQGELLYITSQNMVEFQALATRPIQANGLGMTPAQASAEAWKIESWKIESMFGLAEETPGIYPIWRHLVDLYGVVGRQVYDARLVAVMLAHGLNRLITMNPDHFRRFAGITIIDPHDV